jgi:hypothetical protein
MAVGGVADPHSPPAAVDRQGEGPGGGPPAPAPESPSGQKPGKWPRRGTGLGVDNRQRIVRIAPALMIEILVERKGGKHDDTSETARQEK